MIIKNKRNKRKFKNKIVYFLPVVLVEDVVVLVVSMLLYTVPWKNKKKYVQLKRVYQGVSTKKKLF